jgi:uncharacterized protein (TIGR01244 family)
MNGTRGLLLTLTLVWLSVAAAAPTAPPLPIPNARTPIPGVLSGGQPTEEQIAAAGAAGYKTVINLRADSESGFAWEPAAVQAAGMTYVSIPVPGSEDFTKDNVIRLDAALKAAEAKGPVLLHCTSGNRVGAMLALRAAWLDGKDPAAALALGEAAGLTRSKATVKTLLEHPAEAHP